MPRYGGPPPGANRKQAGYLVRRRGFDPRTHRLEGGCSFLLSYRRRKKKPARTNRLSGTASLDGAGCLPVKRRLATTFRMRLQTQGRQ